MKQLQIFKKSKRSILIASWHWKWSLTWRWILSYSWKLNRHHFGPYFHRNHQGKAFMAGINMWRFGSIHFRTQPNMLLK